MCFCLGIAGLRTSPGNHNIMSWPDYPFWSVSVIHDELVRNIRDMAWLVVTSFSHVFPTCFHHSIFKWCWSLISTDLFIFWGSTFHQLLAKTVATRGHDLLSAAMSEAIEEIKNCPKTLAMQVPFFGKFMARPATYRWGNPATQWCLLVTLIFWLFMGKSAFHQLIFDGFLGI